MTTNRQSGFVVPVIPVWAIYALLTAAVIAFIYWQGFRAGAARLDAYKLEQSQAATKLYVRRNTVTERVVNHYIKVAGETKTVTEYIDRKVVEYAETNPGYTLDAGWRWLHDNAALNIIPKPGLIPDGAGGAAPRAAEALATVTANYAACNRTADRLDALQGWVRQQQAITP